MWCKNHLRKSVVLVQPAIFNFLQITFRINLWPILSLFTHYNPPPEMPELWFKLGKIQIYLTPLLNYTQHLKRGGKMKERELRLGVLHGSMAEDGGRRKMERKGPGARDKNWILRKAGQYGLKHSS
jgi:hypothetical protein